MISKELCRQIYTCYDQIERCDKLISDMNEAIEKSGSSDLLDAFGSRKGLELGIPSGNNSHRIVNVSPEIAIKVIIEHKEFNQRELTRLNGHAQIQIS